MLNCEDRECVNLDVINPIYHTRCKILDIENPDDTSIVPCDYFKQSETCRSCKNGKLTFYVYDDPLDFEEDYECKINPEIKTSYVTNGQSNSDYQCECGEFEYLMED